MSVANPYHITIAGAGLNGLALAFALKKALGDNIRLTLADPALDRDASRDKRSFAVTPSSRRMFETLGVWDDEILQTEAVADMVITDSRVEDPVRPSLLTFAEGNLQGEPLAYMVESAALTKLLLQACKTCNIDFSASAIQRFTPTGNGVEIEMEGRKPFTSNLLVAADGKRSRLRELANIGWISWPYNQSGIVGTITHSRDHEGKAYEHFLPSGPFAILPLAPGGTLGYRSSIVWTETTETADYLMEFGEKQQLAEVEKRFGPTLGTIALETSLQSFPLTFGIARSFISDRLALLGDAAHAIHPIAGQGLNLGLEDVAALAEIIVDAVRIGLDPGTYNQLELYENARRFDVTAKGLAMDGLNRLFSNDLTPVRLIRDFGLGLVNRLPELKRFFVDQAVGGTTVSAPRLFKGEEL
ncbi:FAD-dependent monooxygenase [Microvirga sp. W0021]|uniref:FAD-dependent monooxygenase n=1 Tax=Hohaiivirga grylli TaxID=3133970 RepID=A0ABV0BF21_9HYPH